MTATASPTVDAAPAAPAGAPWWRRLVPHWLFGLLFLAGAALRVVTSLAYLPALLYIDSLSYLANIGVLRPSGARPVGYSVFLTPFAALGDLRIIPVVHHLMGLGLAVGIYVLLLRVGARRWLAALAAAPMLLDGYQLQIEQNVLSETLFQSMVFIGLVVLVDGAGRRRSFARRVGTAAAAGAVLGLAVPVRLIGQFLVVAGVAYLLVEAGHRLRRRVLVAGVFAVTFLAPVLGYMAYFQSWTGDFTLTSIGGRMLYGRVAVLVDCDRIDIPPTQRDLCPDEPLGERLKIDNYVWNGESPLNRHDPPPGTSLDESLRDFGVTVIRQQPLDVTRAVLIDMGKTFWPTKAQFPNDVDVGRWQFQEVYPRFGNYLDWLAAYGAQPQIDVGLASWLRSYQLRFGYTPGPVFAGAILVGLVAGLGVGRARRSPLRAACLVWTAAGAMLTLLPSAYEFSWRYMLPALVTLPIAGVLGITALTRRDPTMATTDETLDGPDDRDPGADPADDGAGEAADVAGVVGAGGRDVDDRAVDDDALARFAEEHGAGRLGPIVVVIAAYNEQDALGGVLEAIPDAIDGHHVDVVVVDDGSTDGTADVARAHGVLLVAPARNRGQGAALRLGYRVARTHGADHIATLDADGQYDPAELPVVLRPLLAGDADFVTGSRRLGSEQTTDQFRRAGVRFYAWLVSALTGQRITDTSFGLRAMRSRVTEVVSLTQPQYQSSELLIGALAHGFRVVEVPTTMRRRAAGESKKGNNLWYGLRYGRVVVGTWLRERARRRASAGQRPASGDAPRTPGDRAGSTSPGTAHR